MNINEMKRVDRHLTGELLEEQMAFMANLESGVRLHSKRKADGGRDYAYMKKKRDGAFEFYLKCGKPVSPPPAPSVPVPTPTAQSTNPAGSDDSESSSLRSFILTQDSDTVRDEEEEENVKEEEVDEEVDDEEEEKSKGEKLANSTRLLTQAAVRPRIPVKQPRFPVVSPFKSPYQEDNKICPDCFNQDCHAYKFGQFCANISMIECKGEKDDLIAKFNSTYRTAKQWDKVINSGEKAKPMDIEEFLEDLPDCVCRYRTIWLDKVKDRERKKAKGEAEKKESTV